MLPINANPLVEYEVAITPAAVFPLAIDINVISIVGVVSAAIIVQLMTLLLLVIPSASTVCVVLLSCCCRILYVVSYYCRRSSFLVALVGFYAIFELDDI